MNNEYQPYTITIPISDFTDLVKESEALNALCIYIDKINRDEDGAVKTTGYGTIDLGVVNAIQESIYG